MTLKKNCHVYRDLISIHSPLASDNYSAGCPQQLGTNVMTILSVSVSVKYHIYGYWLAKADNVDLDETIPEATV